MSPVQLNHNVTGAAGSVQPRPEPVHSRPEPVHSRPEPVEGQQPSRASFDEALQAQLLGRSGVKLSAHAQKRLAERNVQFGADETARLGAAVDRVQQKGADKSLVLMDDLALVVSARNRVVITALDAASAKDGVFTGIDSAVIA